MTNPNVNNIFFEELMPQENERGILNESFDEQMFQDKEEILKDLNNFWTLQSKFQEKMIKNLPLILEKIQPENFLFCVKTLYTENQKLISDNFEISGLLLNQSYLLFTCCNTLRKQLSFIEEQSFQIQSIMVRFMEQAITSNKKTLTFKAKNAILQNKELFSNDIYNQHILVLILNLLNASQEEDLSKITGLQLLAILYQNFNSENIFGFISQSIYSEMQSQDDKIRIEAFTTFFKTMDVLPQDFIIEKGVKMIESMNKDKVNEIRMIFAWNLSKMASHIPFNQFNQKCLPVFLKNFKSKNRFIREDSISAIGQTINSLLNRKSSEMSQIFGQDSHIFKLIEAYFNIPSNIKKFQFYAKKTILKANIKYLSSILMIQNIDSWVTINKFLDKVEQLDKDTLEIAKIEIAKQLGQIVKTIPVKNQQQFVQRIKQEYLQVNLKTSAKTRETTLQILSNVLKVLSQDLREPFAEDYAQIIYSNVNKWRFKYVITEQFGILSELFTPQTVHQFLLPLFFSLCRDDCFIVRKNASLNVYQIMKSLSKDNMPQEILDVQILAFGNYSRFSLRQSYVYIMEGILTNCPENATEEMKSILLDISNDPVINNKICLSRLLLLCQQKNVWFDWFEKIYDNLIEVLDIDLLNILYQTFEKNPEKLAQIKEKINILNLQKKKIKEDEKSHISSLKSESEAESENENNNSISRNDSKILSTSLLEDQQAIGDRKTKKPFDYLESLASNFYEYSVESTLNKLVD